MRAKSQLVLGIMSGTSIDAVDYALCEVGPACLQLIKLWSTAFPSLLRSRLHNAASGRATSWETAQLHHDLGRFYARHALRAGIPKPHLVGVHGQTIFHRPGSKAAATFQIGEPAYLAEALRVPVVSNFRVADLAAGGQGAPLATMFHVRVFGEKGRHVCVNNLGGMSNVTSIDWRRGPRPEVLSFDTGPANSLMDIAMSVLSKGRLHYDRGGQLAGQGCVREEFVKEWLHHRYFLQAPPKSTGRELFGESFFDRAFRSLRRARLSNADVLATMTAFSARSLALNYKLHLPSPPDAVVLAGGGASNKTLRQSISTELQRLNPRVEVCTSADRGWPVQSVEPAAFALLAWLRTQGKPGNLPRTTGARRAVLLGQISAP